MKFFQIRNICIFCLINLILYGCIVIPKTIENTSKCDLYTKKITLKMHSLDANIGSHCRDEDCLLVAIAPVTISTIVSGSIMIVGNTVHWIEKEGTCDEGIIKESVANLSESIKETGGWVVDKTDKMIEWIKGFSTSSDEN